MTQPRVHKTDNSGVWHCVTVYCTVLYCIVLCYCVRTYSHHSSAGLGVGFGVRLRHGSNFRFIKKISINRNPQLSHHIHYSSKSPISTSLLHGCLVLWKHEQAGSWWGVSVVPMSDQAELPLTRCNITLGSRGQTGNNHRITRCQTPGRYCK